jgi:hypothetical protein
MAKTRNHQVTRSILKSFPNEASKVLGKEENRVEKEKKVVKRSEDEEKAEPYQSEGSGMESEEGESSQEYSEDEDMNEDEHSVDFDASSGTENEEVEEDEELMDDEFSETELQSGPKKASKEKSLGLAMAQILKQNIPAPSEEAASKPVAPILAKRKAIERGIEDAKLEARARAVLKRQRNASKDSARLLTPDATTANYERGLRKAATKGVVQLFNAIHQHQVNKERLAREKKMEGKGKSEVAKEIKQASKTSFLEMLKGGASSIAIRK